MYTTVEGGVTKGWSADNETKSPLRVRASEMRSIPLGLFITEQTGTVRLHWQLLLLFQLYRFVALHRFGDGFFHRQALHA